MKNFEIINQLITMAVPPYVEGPEDARSYNELIISWNSIEKASHEVKETDSQTVMDI